MKKWDDGKKNNLDFIPELGNCKDCLDNIGADTQHLFWDCKKLEQERNDALGALNRQDKPSTLDEWINTAGDSERRCFILRSLVDFPKTANPGRDLYSYTNSKPPPSYHPDNLVLAEPCRHRQLNPVLNKCCLT